MVGWVGQLLEAVSHVPESRKYDDLLAEHQVKVFDIFGDNLSEALEEGREVFSVPGEITSSLAAGTNRLLRAGATPLTSPDDVLEALGVSRPSPPTPDLSPTDQAVLRRLRETPASPDELARATALDAATVGAALVGLELAGLVAESEGLYRGVGQGN